MDTVVYLFTVISAVSCIQYDGLRVKFGWTDALADVDYFFTIPRTISEVENEGWQRVERPPGPLPDLRMYCPPGRNICPLYDTAGFVAGLMVALPVDEYEAPSVKPEKKFIKWQAPASEGEPAREYWTATLYFVSEESLKAGAGPQVENGATLQDGGVWVADLDGRLMRVPSTEGELTSTPFKKQNCLPNMGTHYYYNMTKDLSCEDILPWFALISQGDLVGMGFQMFGKIATQKPRDWFEAFPSAKAAIQAIVPYAPACMLDWGDKYNFVSIHIYFVKDPWNIKCRTGDSIEPAPPLDRLMLNGYRYMNQISDEVLKLISG